MIKTILIEVSGGNISEIYSTDKDIKIGIIDHDNLKNATSFEEIVKELRYCYPVTILSEKQVDDTLVNTFEYYDKKLRNIKLNE